MWRITLLVVLIPLAFWGCVNKEYSVTETYTEPGYRTDYKTEVTTEIQKEIIRTGEDLITSYGWYNQGTTSGKWGSWCVNQPFWYFNYTIPSHGITTVEITSYSQYPQIMAYDLARIEEFGRNAADDPDVQEQRYCDWLDEYNNKIAGARLMGNYSTGSDQAVLKIDTSGVRSLSIVIPGNAGGEFATFTSPMLKWADTRDKEVKNERQVAVQVPITVEKQRMITKTHSVPFWEALSGK